MTRRSVPPGADTPASPALSVSLLGGIDITLGDERPTFTYRKSRALIAYLVMNRGALSRNSIAHMLWPELSESRALANLRVVLNDVRKALGDAVVIDAAGVELGKGTLHVDCADFARALDGVEKGPAGHGGDAAALRAALALYRGPFLDGFFVSGSDAFDGWVGRTRELYHRMAVAGLQMVADAHLGQFSGGDHTELVAAVEVLGRLVAMEPWNESFRRSLMSALAESGNPDAALGEYRRLRAVLATDFGTAPHPDTLTLAESIAEVSRASGASALAHGALHGAAGELPHGSAWDAGSPSPAPAPPTPLLGRTAELSAILGMLGTDEGRLVTVTGPGGVGKTRLAVEALAQSAITLSPPVRSVFVDMSGSESSDDLVPDVAGAMGIALVGLREPFDELCAELEDVRAVILLDNLEQLLPAVAPVVAQLVASCPCVHIIATSRVRLGLRAEHVVRVRPFELADARADALPHEFASEPAVELFAGRAAAAGAELGEDDMADVHELCRRLDGLPLAIEMAAYHARSFSPREMLASLASPIDGLPVAGRDRPERHRTLHDSIAWSYRLLDDDAQRLLRHLGVFYGGASLDVLTSGFAPDCATPKAIVDLIESGLAERETVAGVGRLHMMESTRAFARQRLVQAGEEHDALKRHAGAYATLASFADSELRGRNQVAWLDRLELEHDNLRAAIRHDVKTDPRGAIDLVNSLAWFWHVHGHLHEGRQWLDDAIGCAESSEPHPAHGALARALYGSAVLAIRHGETPRALALIERAEKLIADSAEGTAADSTSAVDGAMADFLRGFALSVSPDTTLDSAHSTIEPMRRAVACFLRAGDPWNAARTLVTISAACFVTGDMDGALAAALEGRSHFAACEDMRGWAMASMHTGIALASLGRILEARGYVVEALYGSRDVGDRIIFVQALLSMAVNLVMLDADSDGAAGPVDTVGLADAARYFGAGARLGAVSGLLTDVSRYGEILRASADQGRQRLGGEDWDHHYEEGHHLGMDVPLPAIGRRG